MHDALITLGQQLKGHVEVDDLHRTIYATDASVYQQMPLGVAFPVDQEDIQLIVKCAQKNRFSLIPRAAGTSLAGQCVGDGLVVDVSRYMTEILEVNTAEQWVRVQPGVIRNELNRHLAPLGFHFGPNTSTASRCMIGGMVGNNSCGTSSIEYGSTRDHLLALKVVLSDGSVALFESTDQELFSIKCEEQNLEGKIYQHIQQSLSNPEAREEIKRHFPKPEIKRRNTGYAVDLLAAQKPFNTEGPAFNFCTLLAGSEGTLAFTTEVKLHIDPLPPPHNIIVAIHCSSVEESLRVTQSAMTFSPNQCELMDKIILDCTKGNIEQSKNRFFLQGDPAALVLVEFRSHTNGDAHKKGEELIAHLIEKKLGYAHPIIEAKKTNRVWNLRNAGLGLLANIPGDKKAVACIEDTAVALSDLPAYIDAFTNMMERFGQRSVYYAHAGAGELHLRPILNLKKSDDVQLFHDISEASAKLVKSFGGSLSGEHGDGRVRAPFIPLMVGDKNYALFKEIKNTWDPDNIFNPGKIVDAAAMNTSLRYTPDETEKEIRTVLSFESGGGLLRMAEKCNGSGDCRNPASTGATMCPSYQATRDEKDSTRARANALRNILTKTDKQNPFDHPDLKAVMDLCVGCKGCTSECPSNVDISSMKSEFLYQYYKSNKRPVRDLFFTNNHWIAKQGLRVPLMANFFSQNGWTGSWLKKQLGVSTNRTLPAFAVTSLRSWYAQRSNKKTKEKNSNKKKTIYFFCDEFINNYDFELGKKSILLLELLGYDICLIDHAESGRAALSKGFLEEAKYNANALVKTFHPLVSEDTPLVGVEPSAILTFRDEIPRLVDASFVSQSNELKKHVFLIDEFLSNEIKAGAITSAQFLSVDQPILLHGHCHQKALSDVSHTAWCLSLMSEDVSIIPSGCCGMAGSFGYEEEHYEVSMQIGELVLFPSVRQAADNAIIVAPGTSCRHQIKDGTGRKAVHAVEVLWDALIK